MWAFNFNLHDCSFVSRKDVIFYDVLFHRIQKLTNFYFDIKHISISQFYSNIRAG